MTSSPRKTKTKARTNAKPTVKTKETPILKGEKVTKKFGGLTAVASVDFEVRKGEIMGLIGPNGSGKSTLINTISGFYAPDDGIITFNGIRISGRKPCAIARLGIGRTFQFVRPFEDLSALDNITVGVLYGTHTASIARAERNALEILEFVQLAEKRDIPASDLTMAERKRLEIGRALSIRPQIILLDEVFAGLNETEAKEGISLILRISRELEITILMIEHILSAITETCDRVMVLNYGRKIAEGKAQEIMKDPTVVEAYLGATYVEGR
jgi:branched-chain amino acid transport system ATP-binding protein